MLVRKEQNVLLFKLPLGRLKYITRAKVHLKQSLTTTNTSYTLRFLQLHVNYHTNTFIQSLLNGHKVQTRRFLGEH
jgi:hypothetical protein